MSEVNKKILREGPSFTVKFCCSQCSYFTSEYYCVEDGNSCDSGFDHTCTHASLNKPENTHGYDTPQWCPLLLPALKAARKEIEFKIKQTKKP